MRQLLGNGDLNKSVTITYPIEGSTLRGVFDITALATDETSVAFYVGATLIPGAVKENNVWIIKNVDSTQLSDGQYTLNATATYLDATTETHSVNVTLDNSPQNTNPTPMPSVGVSTSQKTTVDTNTPYTSYVLSIDGPTTPADAARMWVPIGVNPGDTVSLVWFFHAAGSSEAAMNDYGGAGGSGGFTRPAGQIIDQGGAITLCINAGGTLYNNPEAERHALNAWKWVSDRYNIDKIYFQAESHGGALSTWLYGNNLLYGANVRGLMVINAVYTTDSNSWWYSWLPDESNIRAAYNDDRNAQRARNPASISSGKFTNKNVFSMVDPNNDAIVPAQVHGIAFINKIDSVAADASYETHDAGHSRPSNANSRFMTKIAAWGGL